MQAINSTIEILLVDNNQACSRQIECSLATIESHKLRLIKVHEGDNVHNVIGQHHPDLIFYICHKRQKNSTAISSIKKYNSDNIPIIFFIQEEDSYKSFSTKNIDSCLLLSEISPALLSKSIYFSLERAKHSRQLKSVQQENIELSAQLLATKNLLQTIVDNSSTLVWMCNAEGKSTYFNQAWSRILGKQINRQLEQDWLRNIHPLDLEYCKLQFRQALAKKKGFTISYRLINSDLNHRWISNYAVPQFTVDDNFQGFVGYCFDITSQKRTEQKLIQRAASD